MVSLLPSFYGLRNVYLDVSSTAVTTSTIGCPKVFPSDMENLF